VLDLSGIILRFIQHIFQLVNWVVIRFCSVVEFADGHKIGATSSRIHVRSYSVSFCNRLLLIASFAARELPIRPVIITYTQYFTSSHAFRAATRFAHDLQ
jgi:hypothetical protein